MALPAHLAHIAARAGCLPRVCHICGPATRVSFGRVGRSLVFPQVSYVDPHNLHDGHTTSWGREKS